MVGAVAASKYLLGAAAATLLKNDKFFVMSLHNNAYQTGRISHKCLTKGSLIH
jgi:hypothetical protein